MYIDTCTKLPKEEKKEKEKKQNPQESLYDQGIYQHVNQHPPPLPHLALPYIIHIHSTKDPSLINQAINPR